MILIAAVFGTVARIIFMDGYDLKPIYQNGEFHLNVLGTIIVAVVASIVAVMAAPEQFATPLSAFVLTFGTAYTLDRVVTKLTPNPVEPIKPAEPKPEATTPEPEEAEV